MTFIKYIIEFIKPTEKTSDIFNRKIYELEDRFKKLEKLIKQKELRYLNFDSDIPINAGASCIVIARPAVLFKPISLIVPDTIIKSFIINSVMIGYTNQFIGSGSMFTECLKHLHGLDFDIVAPGVEIKLNITNISLKPHRFFATIGGYIYEQ